MREQLHNVWFKDRITILRDAKPIYIDGMTLNGDAVTHLARPAVANGAGAMASVVMVAPDAEAHLTPIRAILPVTAGASMIGQDILVMRFLATDSFDLRRTLMPVLDRLTQNTLPTSWRL
jgi:urease accessory protein